MGIAPEFSPFVHVEFDLFPVDKKSDYRFHITVEPLKIFHDAVSWKKKYHASQQLFSWLEKSDEFYIFW